MSHCQTNNDFYRLFFVGFVRLRARRSAVCTSNRAPDKPEQLSDAAIQPVPNQLHEKPLKNTTHNLKQPVHPHPPFHPFPIHSPSTCHPRPVHLFPPSEYSAAVKYITIVNNFKSAARLGNGAVKSTEASQRKRVNGRGSRDAGHPVLSSGATRAALPRQAAL